MNPTIYHVDAFTGEPFRGNPAGVMISAGEVDPVRMQMIAAEMNLSETAFLNPVEGGYRIRYYTPEGEIDLCGHATLSSAHILYETGEVPADRPICFFSKAGELTIRFEEGLIVMNFPVYSIDRREIPPGFEKAAGVSALELYDSDYGWKLALLENEEAVRNMKPGQEKLKEAGLGMLIATAAADSDEYDFVVRCFVPGLGISEDPVTGSAHCALVPFWSKRSGKKEFVSHQVSNRGGILRVRSAGERVEIAGEAVTIMKAVMLV